MQFDYREMKQNGAKSNLAKWNLIGGRQFKHVKNCPVFIYCNDWVCSDRTLDVMECKLFGVYVLSKGAKKKTRFNLKRYN